MQIALKITSYQRLTPGQDEIYRPQSDSFTVGRSKDNDWAINDPNRFLSSTHCRVSAENGQFFITDLSTNGVFLNGSERRMDRNETRELEQGDRIRIGDYEFEVLLEDEALGGNPLTSNEETTVGDIFEDDPFGAPAPQPPQADHSDHDDLDDIFGQADNAISDSADDDFEIASVDPVDIDALMGLDDEPEPPQPDSMQDVRERQSPLQDAFNPAPVQKPANAGAIPDNWDEATGMFRSADVAPASPEDVPKETADASAIPDNWDEATGFGSPADFGITPPESHTPEPVTPKPDPEPTPVEPSPAPPQQAAASAKPKAPRPTAPVSGGDMSAALHAFAEGAGIKPEELNDADPVQLMHTLGEIVRECTDGLITSLRGRFEVKNEFRIEQTSIQRIENNPLKFSTSVPATTLQVILGKEQAFKSGKEAVAEGFDDLNAHQTAVIAGMEAAVQEVLKRFNPNQLESRMQSDSIWDNILPGGKKAKYWEVFKLLYQDIAQEVEDDSDKLFGNEFAQAYEQQLQRLKKQRKE